MEIKYTEQELNSIDKTLLIKMFLNLQNQMETLTVEMKALNDKMQKMMEQLVLANNNRFGRKTEKMSDTNQICFMEVLPFTIPYPQVPYPVLLLPQPSHTHPYAS